MYKRSANLLLSEALEITPSVLLSGARQVGKSTLCLQLKQEYRVFDNLVERAAALHDPIGYIATLPKPITLDEIQKAPEVLEGIKLAIDKDRVNGTFLLTGSANVLDMKKAKDTLAGRIIEIPMWPLSQKEIHNKPDDNIVDRLFETGISDLDTPSIPHDQLMTAMVLGGYSDAQPQLFHYRTTDKKEIDFILEKQNQIVAIEVNSSQSAKGSEFRHIADLQAKSKKSVLGIVLYAGENILSFSDEEHHTKVGQSTPQNERLPTQEAKRLCGMLWPTPPSEWFD